MKNWKKRLGPIKVSQQKRKFGDRRRAWHLRRRLGGGGRGFAKEGGEMEPRQSGHKGERESAPDRWENKDSRVKEELSLDGVSQEREVGAA